MSARAGVLAAAAAYGAAFSALSVLRHRAFETGRFDLGNMVQTLWSTAQGRPLELTDLAGEQVSRLGSHVDPLLVALLPLWLVWPSPEALLVAQALAVALGALPVFWLARKHLRSPRAGVLLAAAYLLYPPLQWATLAEFHPVTLSCPLLLFALWYLDEDRLLVFALFAAAAALGKEEVPLVVAALGVWYGLSRRRWAAGAVIAAAGIAATLVAVEIVVPYFNESGSPFYDRYREVGGSPAGVLETALTDPLRLFGEAFDERGLRYLAALVLPLAALCLSAPLALVIAAPELALNLLSSISTQTSVEHHYTAGLVPGLVAATVFAVARLARGSPRRAEALGLVVALAALIGNYRLGALPVWDRLPGGASRPAELVSVSHHDRVAARALELIPPDAGVSATNTLGAHLSERRRILSFPRTAGVEWVAVDETRPSILDRASAPRDGARAIARLSASRAWRVVFAEDGILLLRRVRAEQPAVTGTRTARS
ncbi:MAG: DUF2079 domain-containing protein [Gaiellaceae bacterium]